MNEDAHKLSTPDCSSIQVEIILEEAWIHQFLSRKNIVIALDEKNHLSNLQLSIQTELLILEADILEKEGSSIELAARPVWDASQQLLLIEDVKLQTNSKNIWVKSAGWFAQIFLNSRIDKKIEDEANLIYRTQLEKIKKDPVIFPIPKAGKGEVDVSSITILELKFLNKAILVRAKIDGFWKLELSGE
ncbi:MAG: DUF4403 family protein [Saprospiraceae bacterium]